MIIQIPAINGLGKTKDCELAPEFICKQLKIKSKTIKVNNDDLDEQGIKIYKGVCNVLKNNIGEKIIFIGGDHSISYYIGKAFLENAGDYALLVFDAHPDLMEPMQNPTHEEWLRALIEEKNAKEILLIGIRRNSRNIDKREIKYAKEKLIKIIYSDEFEKRKKEIIDFCRNKQVYISLDIDVFDSSLVDSTGYAEKNGLKKDLIKLIKIIKNVVVLDLVEVNPKKGNISKTMNIIQEILK